MNPKYLLGTAAAALLLASGAARAADVMPIVVTTTPVVPVVTATRKVNIDISATTSFAYYPPGQLYIDIGMGGDIDVQSATGLGFRLSGGGGATLYGGGGFGGGLTAEIYKAVGNAQFGFFASPLLYGPFGFAVGPTFRYETPTFEFRHTTSFAFQNGDRGLSIFNTIKLNPNDRLELNGYLDFYTSTAYPPELDLGGDATLTVNDKLDLVAWANIDLLNYTGVGFGGGVDLHLGVFSPYAHLYWSTFGGLGAEFGVDVKKPIGNGPFQLIGGFEMDLGLTGGIDPAFYGYGGIRYLIGEDDDDY